MSRPTTKNPSSELSADAGPGMAGRCLPRIERMTRNAHYRTRAPKGVFIYTSHEQMQAGRERWTVDSMVQRNRARSWNTLAPLEDLTSAGVIAAAINTMAEK